MALDVHSRRKGISTIVGSFFFLVLMFAVFGAILVAFQYQTDLVSTNRAMSNAQAAKIQEQFTLRPIVSGGTCTCTFSVWIDNTGNNSIEIVDIWVINKDTGAIVTGAAPYSVPYLNSIIPPGASVQFFGSSPLSLSSSGNYAVKAVSALGNMRQIKFTAPLGFQDAGEQNIEDKLIAKPSVYAAFPNPIAKAYWGYFAIIIANPTQNAMTVDRASIQLLSGTNPTTIDGTSGTTAIVPTTGWSPTGGEDAVFWQGPPSSSSVTIPAYDVTSFVVYQKIKGPASGDVPIVTVNTNAWTSFGQFGSAKLDTIALYNSGNPGLANIFFTSSVISGAVPASEHKYYIQDVVGDGNSVNYFVTVENTGGSSINNDATLVINLPKGFEYQSPPLPGSEMGLAPNPAPTLVPFDDGSTQLRVNVGTSSIPNTPATSNSKTFAFTVKSPTLTATKLYVWHMYITGTTASPVTLVGSVAEPVVQVCAPPGPC